MLTGTQEKPINKISPFAIEKSIQSVAGTVANVTKMKSGNLLVETKTKQQSDNLLKLNKILNYTVSASAHRTLNSSRGILRDRSQYLSDLDDQEICDELSSQGVIKVQRFISKKSGTPVKLDTFLITFSSPTPPPSLKIGIFGMKVDMFIPNPIRCFKCQKFGHGTKQCRSTVQKCFKCAEDGHQGNECDKAVKCANCGEAHMST